MRVVIAVDGDPESDNWKQKCALLKADAARELGFDTRVFTVEPMHIGQAVSADLFFVDFGGACLGFGSGTTAGEAFTRRLMQAIADRPGSLFVIESMHTERWYLDYVAEDFEREHGIVPGHLSSEEVTSKLPANVLLYKSFSDRDNRWNEIRKRLGVELPELTNEQDAIIERTLAEAFPTPAMLTDALDEPDEPEEPDELEEPEELEGADEPEESYEPEPVRAVKPFGPLSKPVGFVVLPVYADTFPGVEEIVMRFAFADTGCTVTRGRGKSAQKLGEVIGQMGGFLQVRVDETPERGHATYSLRPDAVWDAVSQLNVQLQQQGLQDIPPVVVPSFESIPECHAAPAELLDSLRETLRTVENPGDS